MRDVRIPPALALPLGEMVTEATALKSLADYARAKGTFWLVADRPPSPKFPVRGPECPATVVITPFSTLRTRLAWESAIYMLP
jgi:hypothetical protein